MPAAFRREAFSLEKRVAYRLECPSLAFDLDYNWKDHDEDDQEMGLSERFLAEL
jgi:hypothetical protein